MEKEQISAHFKQLQTDTYHSLVHKIDKTVQLQEDVWERPGGGGGRSYSLHTGDVFEKGGINFSCIHGTSPKVLQKAFGLQAGTFYATGLSIVLHPVNPYVPIIHMNIRYFELDNGTNWFGGGIDLTPHYVNEVEAHTFHKGLQALCDTYAEVANYARFKTWADDYFYLPHRKETRGIGGIFFDRLQTGDKTTRMDFTHAVGKAFLTLYAPLVHNNTHKPYDKQAQKWQALRRGRYVEFNLIHDAGTKFGLMSNGRTESILMSLPPQASWQHHTPLAPNSPEAHTQSLLKKNINWAVSPAHTPPTHKK